MPSGSVRIMQLRGHMLKLCGQFQVILGNFLAQRQTEWKMVLLIVHFFILVFELLKVSSHSGDECEANTLYALLPSLVTAPILTRIRKTSNMCFLILTWNNSSIFSLSAFSMDKNMSTFQTSWYTWGKTLLNCRDKWIYNAFSVTRSWRCFRIGTFWKKSENQYLHLLFRQKEVQLLRTMSDSPIELHNLPDELGEECSPGWRVFLLFSHHFPEWAQKIMDTAELGNAVIALCSLRLCLLELMLWCFFRT